MPRLLDTRLIGYDIADVITRNYSTALAGNVLRVAADGQSMELGAPPPSLDALLSREAELERNGLNLQQFLCHSWLDCTPSGFFTGVFGLAYGMGRFIAVGQNGGSPVIAAGSVSTGITGNGPDFTNVGLGWANINLSGLNLGSAVYHVIYAQGKFVACGENGSILTSLNGYAWSQIRQGTQEKLYRIAYGPGIGYVFIGAQNPGSTDQPGVTIFSKDLSSFTTLATPALGLLSGKGVPIYGVGYGNGTFVAVGGLVSNWGASSVWSAQDIVDMSGHHIATSTDGQNWTLRTTATEKLDSAHYCVEYGNGRFMVGTNQPSDATNVNEPNIIVTDNMGANWFLTGAASLPISNGNVQTISYGNGVAVAGDAGIQLSNDCLSFQKLTGTNVIPSNYTTSPPGGFAIGAASTFGNGLFLVGNRVGKIIRSRTALEVWATYSYVNSIASSITANIPTGGSGGSGGGGGGGGSSSTTNITYVTATTPFVPPPGEIGSYVQAVPAPGLSSDLGWPQKVLPSSNLVFQLAPGAAFIPIGKIGDDGGYLSAFTGNWMNMGSGCGIISTDPPSAQYGLWMRVS